MEVRLPNSSAVQVGGRQERFFCRLGFQGTTATAPRLAWRKSNQFQAPITCIQPDDARAQMIEAHSPFQQGSGKGAVMGIGGPDQEVHGQARTTTEQGMHPIAPQERTGMVSRSVPHRGIGILSAPGQDGSTINDQIAGPDQSAAHGAPYREHEEGLKGWGSHRLPALTQLRRTGTAWDSISSVRQATGQRQSRPTYQPVMHVPGRESRHSVFSKAIMSLDSSR